LSRRVRTLCITSKEKLICCGDLTWTGNQRREQDRGTGLDWTALGRAAP
jgi:hypothetical protein